MGKKVYLKIYKMLITSNHILCIMSIFNSESTIVYLFLKPNVINEAFLVLFYFILFICGFKQIHFCKLSYCFFFH